MKRLTRNLFVVFCVVTITSACSNDPMLKSSTLDQVTISGPPEKFVAAFEIAKKKCEENQRKAQYTANQTANLNIVTFNCLAPETEAETEDTTAATETEEPS